MSRKESEIISVGNGPIPQQEELGLDQHRLEEVCQMIEEVYEVGD